MRRTTLQRCSRLLGMVLLGACATQRAPAPLPVTNDDGWRSDWVVAVNATDIPLVGWFDGPMGPEHGLRPPFEGGGLHDGLLILHPISPIEPARVRFRGHMPAGKPRLAVEVAGSIHGDFLLECVVNRQKIGEHVVSGRSWQTVRFDLPEYEGREVEIVLTNAAGGEHEWQFETAYIDWIAFEAIE